jgi:hypothetical protein
MSRVLLELLSRGHGHGMLVFVLLAVLWWSESKETVALAVDPA